MDTLWQLAPWIAALAAGVGGVIFERVAGSKVWRDVAEGRGEQIEDLVERVQKLEAIVDVLTSEFAEVIAAKVVAQVEAQT